MNPERFRRVAELVVAAKDRPADERDDYLIRVCGDDRELLDEVRSLLATEDQPTPVIEISGVDVGTGSSQVRQINELLSESGAGLGRIVPRRIGRYEIVRVIGEGGMGVVYEARQDNPQRTVALKVIRAGLGGPHLVKRFQHEAHVLGQLHHHGIAHIYEAGTATLETGSGGAVKQPFLAMEFIRGEPLSRYAKKNALDTRQRLDLFTRVCDAVQHAHDQGVIHRDLKPGNILVEANGQPKVLDFGVARVTDADVQTVTLQTAVGQLVGTLAYMSPEQVTGDPTQLDTRSDVYALGVVLFELLSDRLPLDLGDRSIPEAARVVREEEPTRLSSISTTFRGDLETILAKAMTKDKTRRYQAASDLAADIRRYLCGDAIEARRDSALYVLRKAVARYRGIALASVLLVVLLATFGIVSFIQAERNRQLADELTASLTTSNIERGRLFTRTGDLLAAEDLLWREYLRDPRSSHSYWALWELYAQNQSLATFTGHAGELRDIAFPADGKTFASCSTNGTVRIWDAGSFRPLATLRGHDAGVYGLAYSPSGRWLATASVDGTIGIWDADTHDRARTLQGHRGRVYTVTFAQDDRHVVSGGYDDQTVRVWNTETGECVRILDEHAAPIVAVLFNHDVGLLASCASDGTIKLWENLAGPATTTLEGGERPSASPAFSPDGRKLAWGGYESRLIRLWNLNDPPTAKTYGQATNGTLRFLAFEPGGETLVCGGWYRIERWNLATHQCQPVTMHGVDGRGCFSPDGRVIVTGMGGDVRVTEALRDAGVFRWGDRSNVGVASLSPDGRIVACGDDTDHVRLWETTTGRLLARLPSSTGRWSSAQFHPSGKLLATCGADSVVQLWDLNTGTCVSTVAGVHVTTGQSLAFSPDGRTMAVTRPDETVQILDVTSCAHLATLPSVGAEVLAVRFGPRGKLIATTHRSPAVVLWTSTGEHLATMTTGAPPWMLSFRPDGQKLAVGCWNTRFQIWDLETRQLEASAGESHSVVWGVAYRPSDSNTLAACSGDGSVALWDVSAQRNVLTLEPFGGADAMSVSFTPDGKTLVAAGFDGSLCVWDLEYYDRHIAGHLEYQIGRFNEELSTSIQTEQLRAWAENVLQRPWPRIGPLARPVRSPPTPGTDAGGVDPDVIANWGNASNSVVH